MTIARPNTWANDIVPQRSSMMYHASITPGSDAESRPSLFGIRPPLFLLYQSMVASFGALDDRQPHAPAGRSRHAVWRVVSNAAIVVDPCLNQLCRIDAELRSLVL